MLCWVNIVLSLFVSCAFGFAVPGDEYPEVTVIKTIISKNNEYVRNHNLTERGLGDISTPNGVFKLLRGVVGNFDTVELQPNPYVSKENHGNNATYHYNFHLSLKQLILKYQIKITFPFFIQKAKVTVLAKENLFNMIGSVIISGNATCYSNLSKASISKFGNFVVSIDPDNDPSVSSLYQLILEVVNIQVLPLINAELQEIISTDAFKNKYNKDICENLRLIELNNSQN